MMGAFKLQKFCEEQRVCDGEDKVSKLPDCILHHILSFLPTREAVATCILSTRWKYLWASVPRIDFDDSLLYSNQVNFWYPVHVSSFLNFVERVLLLRDSSNIQRFRLSCRVCFNATRVHAWVSSAIRHNVEELDLCLFVDDTFVLPHCVFHSKSLKVAKLEMNCILQLPTRISFPYLRTLHLCLVTFPDDNSTQRLFSGCPVLQELVLLDCEWVHLKSISIFIPSLKSLVIDDLPVFGSSDDLLGCEIKIDAENLVFLEYRGFLSNKISLYNLSSSVRASIHIPLLHKREKEVASRAIKLFSALKNVSFLRISSRTVESITLPDNVPDHHLVFQNLTQLELSMEVEDHTVLGLMKLLHCLPKLESLCFCEGLNPLMNLNGDNRLFKSVPTCFLSSLKNVTLHNCRGNDVEMQFLGALLKHAPLLERMNVFSSRSSLRDQKKQKEFREQLDTLPRGLMQCEIVLF